MILKIRKFTFFLPIALLLTSCTPAVTSFSTITRREIPKPDVFYEANQVETDNPYSPIVVNGTDASGQTNALSSVDFAGKREQLLGDVASQNVLQLCQFLADQTISTTKMLTQVEGQYSFLWFRDLRLVADYRKTFKPPANSEDKVEILRCRGNTRTSNLMELETDLVLLLRPDGRLGVRYIPDNSTIKFVSG
jgi:hypothetical protein